MHTDSYQLESHVEGEMPILRRRDTDYVNGTKLLRLIPHSMTKGVRDNILRGTANRDAFVPPGLLRAGMSVAEATKNLPRKYQGVWIPLANARALAIRFDLLPYARTLLAPDPTEFLVPPSPQPSPGPEASDTESEGSLGLGLDADAPDPDDVLRGWRYERPARDSLAEKPYGWVRMSREMAAGNRGRVGRIT
ncbi:hypothetical protein DFJ74DRAFT_672772 [Hyaloraphidium curvatum]|nr:hypothetical protein DFJ74DRAFT_672772 [Hyaloraphidium curvatum]